MASESILFRKVSTGFSKANPQVIPQRINVTTVLIQKYVEGAIFCQLLADEWVHLKQLDRIVENESRDCIKHVQ